jgi:Helicase HerA, central domain
MQEYPKNPLVKEVPSHLFRFEEKVFGMTLVQLLSDIGAGVGIIALISALPLPARILVGVLLAIPVLILVHARAQDQSLLYWIYLYARSLIIPRRATWQSLDELKAATGGKKRRKQPPSVQEAWIQLDMLDGSIMGYSEPEGGKSRARGRYWAIFEIEGRNICYLPEQEQVQVFGRFETFLTGLNFRLQFITHVEQVHPDAHPPLVAQKHMVARIAQKFPRLARLQQASIDYQQRQLHNCTTTRYFAVVSVSAREEAARLRDVTGSRQTLLSVLWNLLPFNRQSEVSREQVLDQLRVRMSVLKKLFQQLEVRAWPLKDASLLQTFASCLALGADIPSFQPELQDEVTAEALIQLAEQHEPGATTGEGTDRRAPSHQQQNASSQPAGNHRTRKHAARLYRKRLRGLHGNVTYLSRNPQARFEAGVLRLADLVAPTSIEVQPHSLVVETGGYQRYQRYILFKGYGPELLCGWVGDLPELGLPMTIVSQFDPIDSQFMISKLEGQAVKLESQRYSDQKTVRNTRANQSEEARQVRRVLPLLAAHRMQILAVTMVIGIHASSPERLEQRYNYLLSHLRQKQLRVQPATRRHEEAWLMSHPVCQQAPLDLCVNMPSDAVSTFLHCSKGVMGTPHGVFFGFIGSGAGRRPVYLDLWSDERKIVNPHMAILGETGRGKSWLGKTLATGLMGLGIADVCVLDKDDDYLPLHEELGDESQRYNLARGCPINLFDIPYSPQDVDLQDPQDLFSEFLENSLMTALSLLVTKAGTELSNIEEAYLMQVGRATFAAKGITSESIMSDPTTLLRPMPTLSDFIATMRQTPASDEAKKQSFIERLERATYLFSGQTSISIEKPLTIFSIHDLKEDWYPLATYIVQNFLMRHRALRRDERFMAYVVEEASFMLKHPAGRKYLETGSRGFRKLGIAQITLSQHPREFLEEGQVILNNAGTVVYLGLQRNAAEKLHLSPELERVVTSVEPGQAVMRCGNEYAAITIASIPQYRKIFTTDEGERRRIRQLQKQRQQQRLRDEQALVS